ncbi:hypothetical protein [Plantactinospora mayteni]|nr:hypothetical protein [Plantactinospora mayteni]
MKQSDDCGTVRRNLATLAGQGRSLVACTAPGSVERARLHLSKRKAAGPSVNTASDLEPFPEWCEVSTEWRWLITRTQACVIVPYSLGVLETSTGEMVGQIDFVHIAYHYSFADGTTWGQQLRVEMIDGWGLIQGTTVEGYAACLPSQSEACGVAAEEFPPQPITKGGAAEGYAFYDSPNIPAGARRTERSVLASQWRNPLWAHTSMTYIDPTLVLRCDNDLPGNTPPGCVFPAYTWSVIRYSPSGPYPELALHILEAQFSGLPGAYPDTGLPNEMPLTRLTNDTLQVLNRNTACPPANEGGYPRPPGKSCDEYPFASTDQGAFTGSTGPARSYSWCEIAEPPGQGPDGYSVCMINDWQNSQGGNTLNTQLFLPFRILDKDPFYVYIG